MIIARSTLILFAVTLTACLALAGSAYAARPAPTEKTQAAAIDPELRQLVKQNIQRLKELQAYRGLRHLRRLPVRGQRTKTNSRTVRGNVRKTAGSGKRKVDLK